MFKITEKNNLVKFIPPLLLIILMGSLAFFSMKEDSATMDELSHIPAGYSYLSQKDYRINPEHPPLIKDISALPLLTLKLNFPKDCPCWKRGINEQWWFGNEFLFKSGNDADKIIFLARLPMIIILIILGILIFIFAEEFFNYKVALLSLLFFAFSPNFIAHGRLVTTDVGASLGVVLATLFWIKFLKNPTVKNIILAGISFGIALLLKFSSILLVPFFGIITLLYIFLFSEKKIKSLLKNIFRYLIFSLLIALIAIIFLIWPIYQFHILNYPKEKQLKDTQWLLLSNPWKPLKNLCIKMISIPFMRPFAHYLLGLLMATQRVASGNTVYFMGMVSASGWWYYFPIVYILKVPLAFHILTLISLFLMVLFIQKPFWKKPFLRVYWWIKNHFVETAMLLFLAIYWITSISGNLNIGVRHILPTFPFLYILVSLGIVKGTKEIKNAFIKKIFLAFVGILLIWYTFSSLSAFPYYLSYFNELGGGIDKGYQFVVDSNYDWGQDLKRLKSWVKENNINKIYVDYFGGGDVKYYLGDKWRPWKGTNPPTQFPKGNYLAVSATLLQGGRGNPTPDFNQPTGYYRWLDKYKVVARAGTSIFIYYIK